MHIRKLDRNKDLRLDGSTTRGENLHVPNPKSKDKDWVGSRQSVCISLQYWGIVLCIIRAVGCTIRRLGSCTVFPGLLAAIYNGKKIGTSRGTVAGGAHER